MQNTKGATKIEHDFFLKIEKHLKGFIKGEVYLQGVRPAIDTEAKEDAIVTYKAGLNGQFQDGEVMVRVFVSDIPFNGSYIKNVARCMEVENLMSSLELTDTEYRISLINIPETIPEEAIKQHYVLARYKFRRINY